MTTLNNIKSFIAKTMEWICVVLAALLTISTIIAVFCRYALGRTFIQQEELSTFLFVAIVFLGTPKVMNAREHVSVSIVQMNMPPAVQKFMTVIQYIVIIAVQVLLVRASVVWISTNMDFLTPGLRIPYWTIYSVLPIGCILSAIVAAIDLIGMLLPSGKKEESA